MPARSLRAHLLRMLLPPIAAALALGAVISYFPTIEPATQAYDQALVDVGLARRARCWSRKPWSSASAWRGIFCCRASCPSC